MNGTDNIKTALQTSGINPDPFIAMRFQEITKRADKLEDLADRYKEERDRYYMELMEARNTIKMHEKEMDYALREADMNKKNTLGGVVEKMTTKEGLEVILEGLRALNGIKAPAHESDKDPELSEEEDLIIGWYRKLEGNEVNYFHELLNQLDKVDLIKALRKILPTLNPNIRSDATTEYQEAV